MINSFKFYDYSGNNIIEFPYILFIVSAILLTIIFYKYKKFSIIYSSICALYISSLFCVLFFPVVTNPGNHYHFSEDIKYMVTFYNPYYRFLHQTKYSICHLLMFIPLGYLIRYETTLFKSIFIVILIVFGIENLQIYINYFSGYVQYTYCTADIFFHLVSAITGIILYKPINFIRYKLNNLRCM